MAIQFVNIVDFNNNQAESFVLENLASDPTAGNVGRLIYNTSTSKVKVDDGTAFVDISGDITEVAAGTYLNGGGTSGVVTLNHDTTTRTDTTSTATPTYGATFTAIDSLSTNVTGHVTGINTKTVTLPAAEDYTWTLSADSGTPQTINKNDTVDIAGGTNITTSVAATDTVTIDLDDSITLAGTLTVNGTGQSSFAGQVTVPATPSANTDAASKQYVLAQVGGVGGFQGGYNANTNTPALTGSSNVALNQGDFYVVTVAGTFFTENVEVGDFIFANYGIPANSTPFEFDYTVVIADQNVAGEGATDGATQKGVAGFNSAHFNVTANGFVSSDIYAGGSTLGIVPAGGAGTTFLRGDGTWAVPVDTGALGDRVSLTGGSQAGGLTTFTYNVTNSFAGASALDVKCEVISSAGETVYAGVTRSGANLSVEFVGSISDGAYEVLLTYVG